MSAYMIPLLVWLALLIYIIRDCSARYPVSSDLQKSMITDRIASATKNNAIKIIIAICAIFLMCLALKISSFSSLSASEAKWWVRVSELTLILSSILLFVGLFGEWPDSESWKKTLLYRAAKAAVIVGVLGELIGDGGIYTAGDRIQEIDEGIIAKLTCENNALQKALAPRVLLPYRTNRRVSSHLLAEKSFAGINSFSETVVKMQTAPDFESQRLSEDIKILLERAVWVVNRIDESESGLNPEDMREGVSAYWAVNPHNKEAENASRALLLALDGAGLHGNLPGTIPPQLGVTGPVFRKDDPNQNSGFVFLAIGPRPLTSAFADMKASCN